MAGFMPAIHVFPASRRKAWMPGTSPGMTDSKIYFHASSSLSAWLNGTSVCAPLLADWASPLTA